MLTNPPEPADRSADRSRSRRMVAAFYIPGDSASGSTCAIFTVAAITDYFDGYLARSWSMQSPFGRMLDPIADKLLVGAAILMLVHFDRAPILPSLVILCREILVSGLREFLAEVQVGLPVVAPGEVEDRACRWPRSAFCSPARRRRGGCPPSRSAGTASGSPPA